MDNDVRAVSTFLSVINQIRMDNEVRAVNTSLSIINLSQYSYCHFRYNKINSKIFTNVYDKRLDWTAWKKKVIVMWITFIYIHYGED